MSGECQVSVIPSELDTVGRETCSQLFYKSLSSAASDFRAMSSGHLDGTSTGSWELGTRRVETPWRK